MERPVLWSGWNGAGAIWPISSSEFTHWLEGNCQSNLPKTVFPAISTVQPQFEWSRSPSTKPSVFTALKTVKKYSQIILSNTFCIRISTIQYHAKLNIKNSIKRLK